MDFKAKKLNWQDELLAEIRFPARVMHVTGGPGSGLARCATDPPGQFWAVGDRGPNIKINTAIKDYGLTNLAPLADIDGVKVMTSLAHGPALTLLELNGDSVRAVRTVELRGADGAPISGLPPPSSPHEEHEPIVAADGTQLGTDPSGADSEGIVALRDGSFWIADEYGPSLLKVARDGTVQLRWVPEGNAAYYSNARYPVQACLPALSAARRLNRGFEALALSPCETWLFVVFQSPLAHPDRAAHERSTHVRIWKLDAQSGAFVAEYVYPLDKPSSFKRDCAAGDVDRSDIKISEATMLNDTAMLVLERVSASTKLYVVELTKLHETPPQYMDAAMRPTIEQMSRAELKAAGVPLLDKRLIFDTDDAPQVCADLEGMILLSPCTLLLVNDNDFGVEGVATQFWRITLDDDII
jgi:Esterase-like activity of phytase